MSSVLDAAGSPSRPGPLGRLLSHETGVLGQGLRFLMAGGTVAAVYLGTTTVLSQIVGLTFQLALAIGFSLGIVVHFTLQRTFVWIHEDEFALSLGRQASRYLVAAAIQYGATAGSTAVLPSALGLPTEVVYLATVAVILVSNFLVFRFVIFHADAPAAPRPEEAVL